jgi:hypothetical protein
MSSTKFNDGVFAYKIYRFQPRVIGGEERGVKNCEWQNPKRNPAQTPTGFAQIVSD